MITTMISRAFIEHLSASAPCRALEWNLLEHAGAGGAEGGESPAASPHVVAARVTCVSQLAFPLLMAVAVRPASFSSSWIWVVFVTVTIAAYQITQRLYGLKQYVFSISRFPWVRGEGVA